MSNSIRPLGGESASDHDGHVASRSIAPRTPTTALSPLQLEDRSTIYRTDGARREVDAFRELRTQLLSVAEGNFITLVAPVSPGSGGSFVARNLAVAVAFGLVIAWIVRRAPVERRAA